MVGGARLEDDPVRKKLVVEDLRGAKMWPRFSTTKNSFFAFIYAGTKTGGAPSVTTGDFMWQRHPWGLYEGGDMRATQPGADFLLAYFLGRHHGFVDDDTAGVCLAWQ